jgi:hypothetical protein
LSNFLLYFSIACFSLAGIGLVMDLIIYLFDSEPEIKKPKSQAIQPVNIPPTNFVIGTITIITNTLSGIKKAVFNRYKLNTSNVQFCREVMKWTGPILREAGVRYFPTITVRYNKTKSKMGAYIPSTNSIVIYLKGHNGDLSEICSTVLHEVKHHIQSKKDPEFRKLMNYNKYGYVNNRIEVEARDFEKKHFQACLDYLCEKGIISKY